MVAKEQKGDKEGDGGEGLKGRWEGRREGNASGNLIIQEELWKSWSSKMLWHCIFNHCSLVLILVSCQLHRKLLHWRDIPSSTLATVKVLFSNDVVTWKNDALPHYIQIYCTGTLRARIKTVAVVWTAYPLSMAHRLVQNQTRGLSQLDWIKGT